LGVNIDQTLVVVSNRDHRDSVSTPRYNVFKSRVANLSAAKQISTSSSVPGKTPAWNAGGIRLSRQTELETNQYRIISSDDDYMDMFGLEVIAGRKFNKSYGDEGSNVLFNESAVKRIGLSNPEDILNEKLFFWGDTFML